MAQSGDNLLGIILVVGLVSFFAGRASVGEKTPSVLTEKIPLAAVSPEADIYEASPEPVAEVYQASPEPEIEEASYFANCSEARAAGAAPVYEGDPGYAPHLDRDRDGIGCE